MSKIPLVLSRAQRNQITRHLASASKVIEAKRCRILLLLHDGMCPSEVALMVGCVRATVYRTLYRFEELGVDGIKDRRAQAKARKASDTVVEELLGYLERVPKDYGWQRSTWSLELMARQLHSDLGVTLSQGHISRLLKRHGYRRGRPRPALRIPVRGRARTLKKIDHLVDSSSPEEEVLYVDEADIDLNPRIGLSYIKRGEQPLVLTPGKNVKYYVAGALNWRTGSVLYTHGPKKNSQLFTGLLDHLSRSYRRARKIHLVIDNYIIHKSRITLNHIAALTPRIQLHFLPPYSPEHNPIERLWKQMHDNVTRNHRHTSMPSLWGDITRFLDNCAPFPASKFEAKQKAA